MCFRWSPTVLFKGAWGHSRDCHVNAKKASEGWDHTSYTCTSSLLHALGSVRRASVWRYVWSMGRKARVCGLAEMKSRVCNSPFIATQHLQFYSRPDCCLEKLCQHIIINLRRFKPTPVLQAAPPLLTYFTEPCKNTQTPTRGHISKRDCEKKRKKQQWICYFAMKSRGAICYCHLFLITVPAAPVFPGAH